MTICERMFETMSACGIRPAVVSKKLGVPANTLTNWAQRNTDPPAKYIIPICEVMGCSVEYLLTGQKTKKDPSPDISENGREMLELFERLPDREQVLLIGRLQEMVSPMLDSGKKGHASSGEQAV